jgi:hypothetical protein
MRPLAAILVIIAFNACDGRIGTDPVSTAEPAPAQPTSVDAQDPQTALFLGYSAPKPAAWMWHPPGGQRRAAYYVVPGRDGHDAAHITVRKSSKDDGDTVEAMIERWRVQFQGPDETFAEPEISIVHAAGMPATIVELAGAWVKPGAGWLTADQRFVGVVVESPDGNIVIIFAGDDATVARNREPFLEMIRGLKPVGS